MATRKIRIDGGQHFKKGMQTGDRNDAARFPVD